MQTSKFTRIACAILFLNVSFLLLGCPTSKQTPTPTQATISGSITPVSAVLSLKLSATSGTKTWSAIPNSNGTFTFDSLSAGQYQFTASTDPLYPAPSPITVSVTAGQNDTLSPITLTYSSGAQTGTITYTLNGTSYTDYSSNVALSYSSSVFALSGATAGNTNYYILQINLAGVSDANTYNISSSSSYISTFYYTSPGNAAGYWSTNNGGSGSVTITDLDQTTHTASGTFTGTLAPQGASVGTLQISGQFTNVFY